VGGRVWLGIYQRWDRPGILYKTIYSDLRECFEIISEGLNVWEGVCILILSVIKSEGFAQSESLEKEEISNGGVIATEELSSLKEEFELWKEFVRGLLELGESSSLEFFLRGPEEDRHDSLSEVIKNTSSLGGYQLRLWVSSKNVKSVSLVSKVDSDGTWLEDDLVTILEVREVGKWVGL